jgi:threonine synthase
VGEYNRLAGEKRVHVVQVREQEVMDAMIIANRNGNIACTQGGESMAGLTKAVQANIVDKDDVGVLDSTAHMLKFLSFQEMYFSDSFGPEFNVVPRSDLKNAPVLVRPETVKRYPEPGSPLCGEDMKAFVSEMAEEIASTLGLEKR